MAQTFAAWQRDTGLRLEIAPAAASIPEANEILVRNHAIAINPVDWILQDVAIFPWLDYPAILGSDVAGEVVAIGADVDGFRIGDRVLGQAVGATTNRPAHGAFQDFTLVLSNMAARIPASLSYVDAAVLPLGLGTAACGLFQKDHLALNYPSLSPEPTDKTILVWGGSSSVGCNAIQLAVAAGYNVITTASPHNEELLIGLGASAVFDHSSENIVDGVSQALRGTDFAGALHATGNMLHSFDVVSRCIGRRFVSTTLEPPANRAGNVETNHIFATSLKDNEVSRAVYVDFIAEALASGQFRAAPPANVVSTGLEGLQIALEVQKRGVSGTKIVVDLGNSHGD